MTAQARATPLADSLDALGKAVADLLAELAEMVRARQEPPGPAKRSKDALISVDDAAKILCVDRSWIYRRERELDFVVRLGEKTVRVSRQGIEDYIANRNKAVRR